MINIFEMYHSVVLRSLVTQVRDGVHMRAKDAHGTINCFQVNDRIGLMIKHSKKRLSPYVFSCTEDNLLEFELLKDASERSFIALVCGDDGFLVLNENEIEELAVKKSAEKSLSIHVSRVRRGMYSVGGRHKLQHSKPRGFSQEFLQALEK